MNSVRVLLLRIQHRNRLGKNKRKLINRYLRKACWCRGMPALTIGVEALVLLVMPDVDIKQAKKDVLGWMVDSQCFRRVSFTEGVDIKVLLDQLRHASDEVGWTNPVEAKAYEVAFKGVLRLAAMAFDRGYGQQGLQDVLKTYAELEFVQSVFPNQLSLFDQSGQRKVDALPDMFQDTGVLEHLTIAVATDVVKGYSAQRMQLFDQLPRLHWHLSDDEVCILLDLTRAELNAWDNARAFDPGLSSDQLQRITHALNLFACLHSIWGDKRRVGAWMRTSNQAPFLDGMTVLAYLLEEQGHQRAWREVVGWVAQAL